MRIYYGSFAVVLIVCSATLALAETAAKREVGKIVDGDGDGWDDLWVELFKTVPSAKRVSPDRLSPLEDFDGDGVSNHDEMLAFSDPYNVPSSPVTAEELEVQRRQRAKASAARHAQLHRQLVPSLTRALEAIPRYPDSVASSSVWRAKQARALRNLSTHRKAAEAHARSPSSRAAALGIDRSNIDAADHRLRFSAVNRRGYPVFTGSLNLEAAAIVNTPQVRAAPPVGYGVTGENAKMGIWENDGIPYWDHKDFLDILITFENHLFANERVSWGSAFGNNPPVSGHATRVAGTMISAGFTTTATQGVIPQGRLFADTAQFDSEEMMDVATEAGDGGTTELLVSNHSYAVLTGWHRIPPEDLDGMGGEDDYPDLNGDMIPEQWRWFGDPSIGDGSADYKAGFYSKQAQSIDEVALIGDRYLTVWGAGNDGSDEGPAAGPDFQYQMHLGGSSFEVSTIFRAPDGVAGGFNTVSWQAAAKNSLAVGSVDGTLTISDFSSRGPTDDGRIKPDLVSNGSSITTSNSPDLHLFDLSEAWNDDGFPHPLQAIAYGHVQEAKGTSLAAPTVSAGLHLVQEVFLRESGRYAPEFPTDPWPVRDALRSDALKAFAIHTATDLGNPGPDYTYGWGLFNAKACADLVAANAHSPGSVCHNRNILVQQDVPVQFDVVWDAVSPLKITLCWHDPAFQTNLDPSYYDPNVYDPAGIPAVADRLISDVLPDTVDASTSVLVNDLDLRLTAPDGSTHFLPWVLDPDNPNTAATNGDNTSDNVEQILLDPATMNPAPQPGIYTVTITHKGTLVTPEVINEGDPDFFSLPLGHPDLDTDFYREGFDVNQFRHVPGPQHAAVVISGNSSSSCPPLRIKSIVLTNDGVDDFAVVSWEGVVGHSYSIEVSSELEFWDPTFDENCEEIFPSTNGLLSCPVPVDLSNGEQFIRVRSQ